LGRGFPELRLEPLSAADAGLLLDGQPRPPRQEHGLAHPGRTGDQQDLA
jgi:hypothetical protein